MNRDVDKRSLPELDPKVRCFGGGVWVHAVVGLDQHNRPRGHGFAAIFPAFCLTRTPANCDFLLSTPDDRETYHLEGAYSVSKYIRRLLQKLPSRLHSTQGRKAVPKYRVPLAVLSLSVGPLAPRPRSGLDARLGAWI